MQFLPIKTRPFLPPKDDIYPILDKYLPRLKEADILVITSKVLGIHQGRCVKIKEDTTEERDQLVMREAEWHINRKEVPGEFAFLTIKDNTMISSAGIDKSNGNGYYILWPKQTKKLLKEIRGYLKHKFKLKKLGIMSVDSHLIPLRTGLIGVSTGFYGFKPLIDYRGTKDIFGRKLKVSRVNIPDALAALTGVMMGQGNESTPLLLIRSAKFVQFTDRDTTRQLIYPRNKDIYWPLLKAYKRNRRSR